MNSWSIIITRQLMQMEGNVAGFLFLTAKVQEDLTSPLLPSKRMEWRGKLFCYFKKFPSILENRSKRYSGEILSTQG